MIRPDGATSPIRYPFVLSCVLLLLSIAIAAPQSGKADCGPLPPPDGVVIAVGPSQADELRDIVASAAAGTTIQLDDGYYDLSGGDATHQLTFLTPDVVLRSASGNRDAVILDGAYGTDELIAIYAAGTTIADITVKRANFHPIKITGTPGNPNLGTLLHNVRVVDPGEQGIKILSTVNGGYADNGVVECTLIELTAAGRAEVSETCYTGGIDGSQALGWIIRDNRFEGFWCDKGLAGPAVRFWAGSRDTLVEGNVILDCAHGIGFGLGNSGPIRAYPDNPYPSIGYMGHIDGLIRNNFIAAGSNDLFDSPGGFDTGISLEQAHGATVAHNSVASVQAPSSSSIEWRFSNTDPTVVNNLASSALLARDGASATLTTNISPCPLAWFVDVAGGDLHLLGFPGAVDTGTALPAGLADSDIDGDPRDDQPDVGADEVSFSGADQDLAISKTLAAGGPVPGGFLEFLITYEDLGTTSTTVSLTDTMPPDVAFESARWAEGPWVGQPLAYPVEVGNQLIWDLPAPETLNGIMLRLSIDPAAGTNVDLENCVEILGEHVDANPEDNESCASFHIFPPTDAALDIEKFTNGLDADFPPGPQLAVGTPLTWTYVVENTGDQALTQIVVVDSRGVEIWCPETALEPAASMSCAGSGTAQSGAYSNLGIVTAKDAGHQLHVASDPSHYTGVGPHISLEKLTNGFDADSSPGPLVPIGSEIVWHYVVTNTGDSVLTDIDVTDDQGVEVICPVATLAAGQSMACGGFGFAKAGQYVNLGTVTGNDSGAGIITAEDQSHYFGITPTEISGCDAWDGIFCNGMEDLPPCHIYGIWAAEARDCTVEDCHGGSGRYRSWDGKTWCRALITQEFEDWTINVPPGVTTFDFWADWGAWDMNDCGDGVSAISISACSLSEAVLRGAEEKHLTCDVAGLSSLTISKEKDICEYIIIGNPYFH